MLLTERQAYSNVATDVPSVAVPTRPVRCARDASSSPGAVRAHSLQSRTVQDPSKEQPNEMRGSPPPFVCHGRGDIRGRAARREPANRGESVARISASSRQRGSDPFFMGEGGGKGRDRWSGRVRRASGRARTPRRCLSLARPPGYSSDLEGGVLARRPTAQINAFYFLRCVSPLGGMPRMGPFERRTAHRCRRGSSKWCCRERRESGRGGQRDLHLDRDSHVGFSGRDDSLWHHTARGFTPKNDADSLARRLRSRRAMRLSSVGFLLLPVVLSISGCGGTVHAVAGPDAAGGGAGPIGRGHRCGCRRWNMPGPRLLGWVQPWRSLLLL